jgi:hypothetical protein
MGKRGRELPGENPRMLAFLPGGGHAPPFA